MVCREVDKNVLGLVMLINKTPKRLKLSINNREESGRFMGY
jgi:hypothetical protein